MNTSLNWLVAVILALPTVAMAAKKSGGQKHSSNEKCYSRLNQLEGQTRMIFDAFLQKKSKPSFWGPVITVGGPPESCKFRKNQHKKECQLTEENKPTQILIGKKSGTFQILRDWDQKPKSRVGQGYVLKVCADKTNVFPVHLRFSMPNPYWFGNVALDTEIKPKDDWMKTENKKVLSIVTVATPDGGSPRVYKKSALDIQPMINEYMASSAPVAQPAPVDAEPPPALAATVPSVTGTAVPEAAAEAEGAR